MELALPHVVIRSCGPGIGPDLVAALAVHPLEVSEVRDSHDARRLQTGRPPVLVVLAASRNAGLRVVDTRRDFPGVPILLLSEDEAAVSLGVQSVSADSSLQDICWDVMESVCRASSRLGNGDQCLGASVMDIDTAGIVGPGTAIEGAWLIDGYRLRVGDSVLSIIDPRDRDAMARGIERAAGGAQFLATRVLDRRGNTHAVHAGLRSHGNGRVTLFVQPLVFGGPVCGRRFTMRDPITGLLTRQAVFGALLERERHAGSEDVSALLLMRLDNFATLSEYIGSRETAAALYRVATVLVQLFPWPAICGRLMGDTFLVCVTGDVAVSQVAQRAERLIGTLAGIILSGFTPRDKLGASIGIAHVSDANYDLALRLSEAAMGEAQLAGGGKAVVAGSAKFSRVQVEELTSIMDLGTWEVWLQPVGRAADGRPEFHEALARFDSSHRRLVSRADFFTAGRAEGLLERFDRMLLLRVLALLAAHPGQRISANITYETFVSDWFPGGFLDIIGQSAVDPGRLVVEVATRCVMLPAEIVGPRLERLADAGIAVALDDFGSGICGLGELTRFPLAYVKLDEILTVYVDDDPLQRGFVRAVANVCRARGITTIAEHTRTAEQMARLVEDGMDLFQGELLGMPRPVEQVFPSAPALPAAEPTG